MPRRFLSAPLFLGFALWSLCAQSLAAAQRCDHLVAIGVEERAPYQWRAEGGEARGASVELLRRVAKEAGVTLEILGAETLAQAEAEVISGRVDLLIDAELRQDLLAGLDFLHPALQRVPVVAWVARDRAFAYQHWEDLRSLNGVRLDGGGEEWEERLRLIVASNLGQAIRGMLAGESDYVLYEQPAGQVAALRQGWAEQVQVLLPPVYRRPRYLALSHSSACNTPRLRGALATALHRLDGGAVDWSEQVRQWADQRRSD